MILQYHYNSQPIGSINMLKNSRYSWLENLFFPLSYTETQLSFRFHEASCCERLEFSSFFVVGIISIEIASYSIMVES